MEKISIIVPCFNEEKALPYFYKELEIQLKNIENVEFEYIFVDDGSTDNTLNIIKEFRSANSNIRYISFSRNFGKEAAIYAGLEACTGTLITIMDADLQDPPHLLPQMYETLKSEGLDIVGTRRVSRKGEPVIRSLSARVFYKLINKLSKIQMVDGARDYLLFTTQVKNSILELKEYNRFSKGLFSFIGFKIKWIEYENVKRVAGESKWSFWKLFKYALEAITSFSVMPLLISSFLGLIFCLIAFLMIIVIIVKTLMYGDPTSGWPSMVCIILMVSGIQLFSLGIIGQYLSKTYLEVKKRPIYITRETSENPKN